MKTRFPFRIWMFSAAVFHLAEASTVRLYSKGSTVLLKCTSDGTYSWWIKSAHLSKHPRGWTYEPDKNYNWLKVIRRNKTNAFDLEITNASSFDEGLYYCNSEPYTLQMETLPTNMTFDNETKDNKIHGTENIALSIICRVQSGRSHVTLSFIRNNNTVKTGKRRSIKYTLIPTKLDHNVEYTCEARSSLSNQPLRKTVQLNITYKPTVFSMQVMNDEINDGETKKMCCYVVSNPAPSSTRLLNGSKEILVTYRTKQTCYTIKHVSRYDQGNYTCLATNFIGKESVTIVLQVNCGKYQRDIQFTCRRQTDTGMTTTKTKHADHPSVEKSSFSSDTLVIVLLIIIAVLVAGVVLYVRYMKQRFRKRLSVNPTRRNGNESAYYAEINEDNMKQTTSQENDNPVISTVETPVVENSGIVLVNEEPLSASSDHDRNASENLDDGYERPYNTLLAHYQTKDDHVYLTTNKSS